MMGYPTTFIHPIACSTASTTPSPPQFPHVEFTIATHIVACKDLDRFAGFQECKNPMLIVACKNPKLVPGFNKQRGLQPVDQKKTENQPNRRGHAPSNNCEDANWNKSATNWVDWWLIKAVEVIPLKTYYAILYPFSIFWVWDTKKKTKENGFWKILENFRLFSVRLNATNLYIRKFHGWWNATTIQSTIVSLAQK